MASAYSDCPDGNSLLIAVYFSGVGTGAGLVAKRGAIMEYLFALADQVYLGHYVSENDFGAYHILGSSL